MKLLHGQSLIEMVIVIAMTSMVLLAIVTLGNVAIRNTTLTIQRSEANKLATSAMEAVRYVRDTSNPGCGFSALHDGTNTSCYDIDINETPPGCRSTDPDSKCVCNSMILKQKTCSSSPDSSLFAHFLLENTDFSRIIIISPGVDAATAKVDVVVNWPVGNSTQNYTLSTIITDTN